MGLNLFNLADDPSETTNLADQMPEKVAELTELHRNWRTSIGKPVAAQ